MKNEGFELGDLLDAFNLGYYLPCREGNLKNPVTT
jgi:hypothetical protein